jgi:regulatory protein
MASQDPRGDGAARAFELAVAALGRKERTLAEMRALLRAKGVAAEDAEAAITRLIELGELDDERFARRFAEDKRELRGWGPERIAGALAERGVPAEAIERALADWSPAGQVERAASLLAERGQPLDDDRARARALAFLARRGYESEVAYAAIRLAERREAE